MKHLLALTETDQTVPFHEDAWSFGLVADVFHPFGQGIGVVRFTPHRIQTPR